MIIQIIVIFKVSYTVSIGVRCHNASNVFEGHCISWRPFNRLSDIRCDIAALFTAKQTKVRIIRVQFHWATTNIKFTVVSFLNMSTNEARTSSMTSRWKHYWGRENSLAEYMLLMVNNSLRCSRWLVCVMTLCISQRMIRLGMSLEGCESSLYKRLWATQPLIGKKRRRIVSGKTSDQSLSHHVCVLLRYPCYSNPKPLWSVKPDF